jgi:hypothetical protein
MCKEVHGKRLPACAWAQFTPASTIDTVWTVRSAEQVVTAVTAQVHAPDVLGSYPVSPFTTASTRHVSGVERFPCLSPARRMLRRRVWPWPWPWPHVAAVGGQLHLVRLAVEPTWPLCSGDFGKAAGA